MKRLAIRMDSKGRLQIPKDIRQELGLQEDVSVTIENGAMKIEPVENFLNRLSRSIKFKYGNIEVALPALRRAAEKQLLKEVS